jgi:hypothetical protein
MPEASCTRSINALLHRVCGPFSVMADLAMRAMILTEPAQVRYGSMWTFEDARFSVQKLITRREIA